MNDYDDYDDYDDSQSSKPDAPITAPPCNSNDIKKWADKAMKKNSGQMWAKRNDDYFACEESSKTLEAGQYIIKQSESGIFFSKKEVVLDDLIKLNDSVSNEVLAAVADFWTKKQAYDELGFLWKRGVLLYGPPGSGKTSTIQQLAQDLISRNGLVIYCEDPIICAHGLKLLRRIEPDRELIVLLEDADSIISRYGESDLLALLDGELQIEKCVFIATTNYPEKLDRRLTNRPSRFDMVRKIGMPSFEDRKTFIKAKNSSLNEKDLNEWTEKTNGFSIAHLKEVIISVSCLGKGLNETIDHLKNMQETFISSEEYSDEECRKKEKKGIGFLNN